jgi:hypothetical protein
MDEDHGGAAVTESFDVHRTRSDRDAKNISLHNLASPLAFQASTARHPTH